MSQFIRLAVPRQQKAKAGSIVLNATSAPFTISQSGLFIKPIRGNPVPTAKSLYYDEETCEIYHADTSGDFNIDPYWYPAPGGQNLLAPSGTYVGLVLNDAIVVGGSTSGGGDVLSVNFSNGNQFAFSNTEDNNKGGYMINGLPAATSDSYAQITTNTTNILSVSVLAAQAHVDVSDNSYNIFLLSGDVSNNTTCCLDNSKNIWNLTLDVSDNSYNLFLLSGEVQTLIGEESEWREEPGTNTLVPQKSNIHMLKTRGDTNFKINSWGNGGDPNGNHGVFTLGASDANSQSLKHQFKFTALGNNWSVGVSGGSRSITATPPISSTAT